MQITTGGAAGIDSRISGFVVSTLNKCVTFRWKTGNECFMTQIEVAPLPSVSNPMAHASSIRQVGGSK
jgi:hypothetical protein